MVNVTRKTIIAEAVQKNKNAAKIMYKYGLHCIGCHISPYETIENGARMHGIAEKDIDNMIKEINSPRAKNLRKNSRKVTKKKTKK
ncbi:MAG: DUF1858 domain-containing protein [Candidatus Woesearchaeota archaeon]